MCWHDERSSAEATREVRDLDEVRRLFARYRRLARMRPVEVEDRPPAPVEAEKDVDRVPAGV